SWLKAEAGSLATVQAFAPVNVAHAFGEPAPPPAPFALIAPAAEIEWRKRGPVRLRWSPSAGADSYSVHFTWCVDRSYIVGTKATTSTELMLHPGLTPVNEENTNTFYLDLVGSNGLLRDRTVSWTVFAESASGKTKATEDRPIFFYDWDPAEVLAQPSTPKARPVMETTNVEYNLYGYLRGRIQHAIDEYLISTPVTSPAILQVLRDRDKIPVRDPLVPWAGEFAGKYLTSAQLTWRLTRDEVLQKTIDAFVGALIACQQEDGYLGPFPESSRITGGNWDVWGHYHCMLGLMLYYEDTQYEPALDACKKAADLLFETFGPGGPTLTNDGGGGQMNMAVCHGLVLLYNKTGITRYLDLANYIVHEAWNEPGAGGYLVAALAGKPIVEFPQHRWEAIHDWQVLPELYWLTGDEQYRKAFEHMWWSAVKGDRHNTGGLTSGEGFTGSPFNTGAIETCCTVAWIAMSLDMLRLTGDSQVADEIELSTLNSALGAIPHAGRSCAYNVPMNGTRLFGVELHWQAPKGGPDLNCCSVNANRPLGMIAQWALMKKNNGLAVNFYGHASMKAKLDSGNTVTIGQDTEYPREGKVTLKLSVEKQETFPILLRIPRWSTKSSCVVNDKRVDAAIVPGTYLTLEQEWKTGDVIELELDFTPHFLEGGESFANTVSFYRGPILYAYDARYNSLNPGELPKFDPANMNFSFDTPFDTHPISPWILGSIEAADGTAISVVDFS
ncbi:MAG TPA: glycoside hydrolase family 127 protein, partial [Candidatus Hydrogenedentes bacterium]|nr:glycoside hydrolase family 127 protein [Candidatus Hydrogenedentota bacterium]